MSKYFIIIVLFFSAACGTGLDTSVPKKIIPINEMKFIVWDMLKADEYYIRLTVNDTANRFQKENIRIYDQIFRSYGVTKVKFYSSYKYYESHPDIFKVLIDSVDALSKRQRNILSEKGDKLSQ